MAIAAKLKKAMKLGITFEEGYEPTETQLDSIIEEKLKIADHEKEEERIRKVEEKKAEDFANKNNLILKDVDGAEVDQEDYFFPRYEDEVIVSASGTKTTLKATNETAPAYFNSVIGLPVDREELIKVFIRHFPRAKGFLFYKSRDKEVYLIIVPLKYATTISVSNESRPGDFQRHALSFLNEGSVNTDSLELKLKRIAGHNSISTEPIAR